MALYFPYKLSFQCSKMFIFLCFLQLEVLTNLANETNISTILREFQVQWTTTKSSKTKFFADLYFSQEWFISLLYVLLYWVKISFRQTYIKSMDKDFVAATIQAIGRCATNIGEVRDTCLNGLVQLLSNRDGESFYVTVWMLFKWYILLYILYSTRNK